MRRRACACIGLVLGFWATGALAAATEFQLNEAKARANVRTVAGARFDRALGASVQANPKFEAGVTRCLTKYPTAQAVHGYFHFTSATEYRLVLEPRNGFSKCLEAALKGFAVPKPPSVPYFNSFSFATAPRPAGSASTRTE